VVLSPPSLSFFDSSVADSSPSVSCSKTIASPGHPIARQASRLSVRGSFVDHGSFEGTDLCAMTGSNASLGKGSRPRVRMITATSGDIAPVLIPIESPKGPGIRYSSD
jgi:hypothetical protein